LMLTASARTAACRVGEAWSLCTQLPATLAALEAGRITLAKAHVIDAETLNLSDEHTAAVERQVLVKARQQTPGQLRAATRRAVLATDPAAAQHRADRARRERGVRMWPEPDGMATLCAYLPAADAVGVFAVLDEYARRAGFAGDERRMDARRADALVDLVLSPIGLRSEATSAARQPAIDPDAPGDKFQAAGAAGSAGCRCECGRCRRGGGVDVRVTIPYTALLGADDQPGELAGYGPIPAAVARDLAAGGTWWRILTYPASGRPVDYGTTRYRPPEHLVELVITRDQTCQFPGCRVPAHRCDLDHSIPYNPAKGTGPTSEFNLGPRAAATIRSNRPPAGRSPNTPTAAPPGPPPPAMSTTPKPPPLTDPEPLTTPPPPDPHEPPPF
jgi:hypothetical protein